MADRCVSCSITMSVTGDSSRIQWSGVHRFLSTSIVHTVFPFGNMFAMPTPQWVSVGMEKEGKVEATLEL